MVILLALMLCQPPLDAWRYERQQAAKFAGLLAPVRRALTGWWRWSMTERLIFAGASPDVIASGRQRIKDKTGIDFAGDVGKFTKMGVDVTLSINREAQEITVLIDGPRLFMGRARGLVRGELTAIGLTERKP